MFRKVAAVTSLATASVDDEGMLKTAQRGENNRAEDGEAMPVVPSYYLDGARKINVRAMLEKVADDFAISANPADYIFEAIRANTTNVPNENHDAFHKSELLRFDTRVGAPVYLTYVGKPHHVNHRTENPKAARGVILDAHYYDESPALEVCPTCTTRTAERRNRDETGIHCNRCGTVVKDEFVEALVAVDAKKDPLFARGVKSGVLKASSMGCNCLSTTCNVCNHVAYAKPEFCVHIRAGNKGSLWKKEGSGWTKTDRKQIKQALSKRKLVFTDQDFCYLQVGGFEARKAYEKCCGVVFDELSRVDQPADPKALQRELLKAAGKDAAASGAPSADILQAETAALLRLAESTSADQSEPGWLARAAGRKMANTFYVVRVNDDESDTHAGASLEEALDMAMPDEGAKVDYCEVEANDAGAARLMWNDMTAQPAPMPQDGDVMVRVPDEAEISISPGGELDMTQTPGEPFMPGAPPGAPPGPGPGPGPMNIDTFTEDTIPGAPPSGNREPLSPAELGVMPPGASAPRNEKYSEKRRAGMRPFAASYKDWTVKITPYGNAVVASPEGPVFLARAASKLEAAADRRSFGLDVLNSLFTDGLVETTKKFDVVYSPRVAQVVDHAVNDMQGYDDHYMYTSVLENNTDDMSTDLRGTPPSNIGDGTDEDDMQGDVRGTPPDSATGERATDHELGDAGAPAGAADEDNTDMRDKRDPYNMSRNTVLDDETHDHKERLARLRPGRSVADKSGKVWRIAAVKDSGVELTRLSKTATVSSDDLLKTWLLLDKAPATVRMPERRSATQEIEERKAFEARLKKVYAARVAHLEEKHAKEKTDTEQSFVERLARSVFLVAHRQRMNLEASPLKDELVRSLTATRVVGRDAQTGDDLNYIGMDESLARHIVEAAFDTDDGLGIETTMQRAADLATRGDAYLRDAEADLKNLQPARAPITASWQLEGTDPVQAEASRIRQAALEGNPHINPALNTDVRTNGGGRNKRSAIQNALGGQTKVESALGRLRN